MLSRLAVRRSGTEWTRHLEGNNDRYAVPIQISGFSRQRHARCSGCRRVGEVAGGGESHDSVSGEAGEDSIVSYRHDDISRWLLEQGVQTLSTPKRGR